VSFNGPATPSTSSSIPLFFFYLEQSARQVYIYWFNYRYERNFFLSSLHEWSDYCAVFEMGRPHTNLLLIYRQRQ
jgi:hypothetical protein